MSHTRTTPWHRLAALCLALILGVGQAVLFAHAAGHAQPQQTTADGYERTCGHDHAGLECGLCQLAKHGGPCEPPVGHPCVQGLACAPARNHAGTSRARPWKMWICTGPRGPPAA